MGHRDRKGTMEEFNDYFGLNKDSLSNPGYLNYLDNARTIWNVFSGRFTVRPRSKANEIKGTNRGVELWIETPSLRIHVAGIHIGSDYFKLYIHDKNLKELRDVPTWECTEGINNKTYTTIEECIGKLCILISEGY